MNQNGGVTNCYQVMGKFETSTEFLNINRSQCATESHNI